jgi:hypothetical protein
VKIRLSILVFVCGVQFCTCAARPSPAADIAPSSGKKLCSALVPADFTKLGIPVKGLLSANVSPGDNTSAYCSYESKSGDIEFDVFYPAGKTPQEVLTTEKTVLTDGSEGKSEPSHVPGADSAKINLAITGKAPSAGITVRRKSLVLAIYIPASRNAKDQLISLAQTALGRLQP